MKNLKDTLISESSQFKPKNIIDHNKAYDLWEDIIETLGEEKVLSEVFNMFDTDSVVWFMEHLNTDYELNISALN